MEYSGHCGGIRPGSHLFLALGRVGDLSEDRLGPLVLPRCVLSAGGHGKRNGCRRLEMDVRFPARYLQLGAQILRPD